ncbi:MAG TPA: AAA family ATPase [Armatimonadota bacterium]|nr:AAA family ATPase [Armatimonadota bacterium]
MREIDVLIRARYSLLYVVSWEERRVLAALREIVVGQDKNFYTWSETMGMRDGTKVLAAGAADSRTRDPLQVLDAIRSSHEPAVYVLKDFHVFLNNNYPHASVIIRKLRDLADALHTAYATVMLLSPVLQLPEELKKDVTVMDYDLPGLRELDGLLTRALDSVRGQEGVDVNLSAEQRERVLKAALGLTLTEAENVFAKCIVEKGRFDVDLIVAEKQQLIRKSGVLEYFEAREHVADIGGLEILKAWLQNRALAFTEKAQKFGLPAPRGILLLGVQGCGKSLTAKAVAHLWRLPLLRLDVGRIFAGLVGSSEENMRRAIQMAETVSPCVLWLDEIEKGLAGVQSSGYADSGVTARVFATLNTWMQEKIKPVFVVATANDISQLPPELLRKGRFDEIFFVDLPSESERKDIFAIHLRKRNRDPDAFDLDRLGDQSAGFSGAEIEQAVISALYAAFEGAREITTDDVLAALKQTVPLSVTMREEIGLVRRWAKGRARPASKHGLADLEADEDADDQDGRTDWVAPGVWGRRITPPEPR